MKKYKKHIRFTLALSLICIILIGLTTCDKGQAPGIADGAPSVYYWRTTLRLDSTERAFLAQHHIEKVYLHLFDVVVADGKCQPAATLAFNDTLPADIRIVPTVFLTEECLHADTTDLASHIVARVAKMCQAKRLRHAHELQIDCDWTPTSREAYFGLLARIRTQLAALSDSEAPEGWRLSTTIRLHQLSQPAPPVAYGVLMLYNTDSPYKRDSRNPIFAPEDIQPYLRSLQHYSLPLVAAYPNFRWQRLFHGDEFKALLYSENLSDSTVYEPVEGDSLYRVVQGRTLHVELQGSHDVRLLPGDEVVVTRPNAGELISTARLLHKARPSLHNQVIFYHLDHASINQLNQKDYETMYHLQ
ncbi:MAG: hypothetical protein IJ786_03690 [Bacteroidaceae bacterium]|nr:hypothetical protein [Bacteroidaceae bacterium]